jgi:aerobic-type carbon monoxide dehydrogenase small subunit (CoxS/CutS family)
MSTPIRFFYRGAVHEVSNAAPTQTVLQHLREDLHCTGTKEGCAEGDCGACTVVIGSLENGQLEMKAVNSCIQFTPTLDGKALFTVEDLQQAGGALHPVQQALVECHGSQCGFCTPGFAMSLWGMYLKRTGKLPVAPRDRRHPVRQPVPLHRLPSHHRRRPPHGRTAARGLRPRGAWRRHPAQPAARGRLVYSAARPSTRRAPRRAGGGARRPSAGRAAGRVDRRRPVGHQADARADRHHLPRPRRGTETVREHAACSRSAPASR